ncbi:MAG: PQQ-dependent sugar dehydrogenase [Planctomycetota bacterium]
MLWGVCLAMVVLALPGVLRAQEGELGSDNHGAHGEEAGDAGDIAHGGGGEASSVDPADETPRTERVWAAVGLTQNPVAFCIGPDGSVYVAESARAGNAVTDTRDLKQLNGVIEDLQMTSVADRLAQIERWTANGDFEEDYFTRTEDRVRIVRDTDGDGIADESDVFAGGFNDPLDGIGAGVLWLDGGLFYTCIPHVWRLEDRDGDGDADEETPGERTSLSYGYGIRWAFYGHDLHGLTMGPDGRIYFSMGDRGFSVETQEGETLRHVERGAVLRMWPDGSGLEVFHVGLRNPQELAFDNYGNLYTGDNNCDAGDKARFIQLVEGGDSGWHQDVQSLPERGPWMREKMWELRRAADDPTQPAWIIPPIAHIGHGPSGLAHYPGTGDNYPANGSFLMADFPGGVRHIVVEPDGAWSRVASVNMAVSGKDVTDICWGYDGRLYLSDWGGGWKPNPNGYLFTQTNDAVHADPEQAALIAEVASLFAEGFAQRGDDELITLLEHADQRVRLHAQYEVAKRDGVAAPLGMIAQDVDAGQLQRIHAIWTLGMIARREPGVAAAISPLLTDADPQVRTQAVKTLGDLRYEATEQYIAMLEDEHAQARFYAAIALGKTQAVEAIKDILMMLSRNDCEDPMLRHAGSYALSMMPEGKPYKLWQDLLMTAVTPILDEGGRVGMVLALRRNAAPQLVGFLEYPDLIVVAEAARAIYDMQIVEAMPALAALFDQERRGELSPDITEEEKRGLSLPENLRIEPILRRVIEANAQLGGAAQADRLARLAADPAYGIPWRKLALQELDGWDKVKHREGVWGHWRPRPAHDVAEVVNALAEHIDAIEAAAQGDEQLAALAAVMRLKHVTESTAEQLALIALDADAAERLRQAAADKLAERYPLTDTAADTLTQLAASGDAPDALKNHARSLLTGLDASRAVGSYLDALANGTTAERQQAVTGLAGLASGDSPEAIEVINALSQQLKDGSLDPALRLEAYEAVLASPDPQVAGRAVSYRDANTRPGDTLINDTLLAGGDVARGRVLAYEDENANCLRCHSFARDDAGGPVGPPLYHIGSDRPPGYLLRSMLEPSADIADGYQTTALTLIDGSIKSGRIVSENAAVVVLANAEGELAEIPVINIEKRTPQTVSMMPAMGDRLTAHELRDLVTFLASLQDERGPAPLAAGASAAGRTAHADSRPGIYNPMANIDNALWLPLILLGLVILFGGFMLLTYWLNVKD